MTTEQMNSDILALLANDSRMTAEEIAKLLHHEPEQVHSAIARMEKEGIIVKYSTLINWEKFDSNRVDALIEIKVTLHDGVGFDTLAERIYHYPEVRSLYLVSGGYDLLVQVEGKSLREVAQFVNERLATMEGVLSTATHFVLKKYKVEDVAMEPEMDDQRLVVSP